MAMWNDLEMCLVSQIQTCTFENLSLVNIHETQTIVSPQLQNSSLESSLYQNDKGIKEKTNSKTVIYCTVLIAVELLYCKYCKSLRDKTTDTETRKKSTSCRVGARELVWLGRSWTLGVIFSQLFLSRALIPSGCLGCNTQTEHKMTAFDLSRINTQFRDLLKCIHSDGWSQTAIHNTDRR